MALFYAGMIIGVFFGVGESNESTTRRSLTKQKVMLGNRWSGLLVGIVCALPMLVIVAYPQIIEALRG